METKFFQMEAKSLQTKTSETLDLVAVELRAFREHLRTCHGGFERLGGFVGAVVVSEEEGAGFDKLNWEQKVAKIREMIFEFDGRRSGGEFR